VAHVCDKLLPIKTWNMIATAVSQDQIQLRLLKVFAEMITYTDKLDNASERINAVYHVLLVSLPRELCDKQSYNLDLVFSGIHAFAQVER